MAKSKGPSPTARALAELRKLGYTPAVVEKTIPRSFIKQDLFGFIDILAIRDDETLGVQATSGSNHAARRTKSLANEVFPSWCKANRRFEVWSFTKPDKRWVTRREELTPEMIPKP